MTSELTFEQEFYGDKELRWFQIGSRNAAAMELARGIKRILIVQPTGCGKTLTITASLSYQPIRDALGIVGDRPLRVLFCSHKHRLLTQAEKTFVGEANVEVFTQSIFSEIPAETMKEGWDITVLDESHHEACMTFQLQLEEIGEVPLIGMTATPDRPDGMLIKFEVIIELITREQAVEEGYLAQTSLTTIVDSACRNKIPISTMFFDQYHDQFGQTMVFFRTKNEVREMTAYLLNRGYRAIAILNQSEKEVEEILNQFSAGTIQFLVNCNKINEGVDVVGCTDIFCGRSYGSYPQLNQVIGRAARPDSPCRVWELVNPLSGRNLDSTVVVGTPEEHRLVSRRGGKWREQQFDYVREEVVFESVAMDHSGGIL